MSAAIQDVRKRLEEATAAALADITAGRAVLDEKTRALRALEDAPPSRVEAEAGVRATVEETAAYWLKQRGSSLLLRGFANPQRALAVTPDWDQQWWPVLCVGDPERAVATLMGLLDRVYATGGPHAPGLAFNDRAAAIAKLQAEVSALEADDEARTDEAIDAGLGKIEHRPDVRDRKQHEAVLAEREAERAEYQRKRTAAVDAADREARGLASAREAR